MGFWKKLRQFWHFIWNDDSILSWVLSIVVAFVLIRFIFYPIIGLILATSHPVVAIVSGSMEHSLAESSFGVYTICGRQLTEKEKVTLELFWELCGTWYEEHNISKEKFSTFPFRRGMNRGDIIVLRNPGAENIRVGDVIVFIQPENQIVEPIIHRVVAIDTTNDIVFQTKGDHNEDSILIDSPSKYLNEFEVRETDLVGKSIFRIPYVGYIKIWAYEGLLSIRRMIG